MTDRKVYLQKRFLKFIPFIYDELPEEEYIPMGLFFVYCVNDTMIWLDENIITLDKAEEMLMLLEEFRIFYLQSKGE